MTPRETTPTGKSICDCERSHNGLGITGRECDCQPDDVRRIGVQQGIAHALVKIKMDIDQRCYRPIPPHHFRRLRERELQVEPLRAIYAWLDADLRRLQGVTP